MKGVLIFMNPKIETLIKAVKNVSAHRRPYEVFKDFIALVAIRISNRVDPVHAAQRETTALHIQEGYSDDENFRMNEVLLLLTKIINENLKSEIFEDVLGLVFENMCVKITGQEFTPRDIACLIAQITFQKDFVFPKRGYIKLNEPTCGSGTLVLTAAEQLQSMGFCCFEQLVAFAADIEIRSVYMSYIQLSLYGIPAVVSHGNTLTCEEYSRWYTPMYIQGNWVWKAPLGFTQNRSLSDEALKRLTDPYYANWRYIEKILNTKGA